MKNQERILDLISNKKYKDTSLVNSETFAEMAIRLCESKNITTSRLFSMCTFLNKDIFNRLKSDSNYVPRENTAYTICFGLQLSFAEASCLLQKGRYSLVPVSPQDMYRELLTEMLITGFTYIPDCNIVLKHYGNKQLGKQ